MIEIKNISKSFGDRNILNDITAKGAKVDIAMWLRTWREQARIYQEESKRFWLYR